MADFGGASPDEPELRFPSRGAARSLRRLGPDCRGLRGWSRSREGERVARSGVHGLRTPAASPRCAVPARARWRRRPERVNEGAKEVRGPPWEASFDLLGSECPWPLGPAWGVSAPHVSAPPGMRAPTACPAPEDAAQTWGLERPVARSLGPRDPGACHLVHPSLAASARSRDFAGTALRSVHSPTPRRPASRLASKRPRPLPETHLSEGAAAAAATLESHLPGSFSSTPFCHDCPQVLSSRGPALQSGAGNRGLGKAPASALRRRNRWSHAAAQGRDSTPFPASRRPRLPPELVSYRRTHQDRNDPGVGAKEVGRVLSGPVWASPGSEEGAPSPSDTSRPLLVTSHSAPLESPAPGTGSVNGYIKEWVCGHLRIK